MSEPEIAQARLEERLSGLQRELERLGDRMTRQENRLWLGVAGVVSVVVSQVLRQFLLGGGLQ
ncbi:hypothetical protein CBW24_07900 [Pacificitalea manganoxidans]|uniref:Uncharacterized protein n=1 Tax=Pacificitalea manganoxidans TaxID=1411902 RepID=A0A291LZ04_9RHOB|nr:hypothetical protein [Pacificitalea manganoxidans]ATI41931.1 hypothetical protein CBW24_07900 [Pacificitalea manganoxidans]MDR6309418.1 hypothetical protein [Pacificitalea manganoxidans]OWU68249.1 hypothetical protein ATO2_12785 [Roseovarius sp. 22II1-1F6A]